VPAQRKPAKKRVDFWLAPLPAGAAGSDADEVLMRCLLVDDNEEFIETARRVLDRNGVRVTGTASNITEALRQAWKATPEFRLGQLVESQGLFQELQIDPYYVEDDEMLAALESWPDRFPMARNGSGEQD